MDEAITSMSFRERNLWAQLFSTVVFYASYFLALAMHWATRPAELLVGVIAAHAVTGLLLQALFARLDPPQARDERDVRIELAAARGAYFVLLSAVMCLCICMIWTPSALAGLTAAGNLVLLCCILAEVVRFSIQVTRYRREA